MGAATNRDVRVGLLQMSCASDPRANLEKAVTRIREAAAQGAQIVCLQELFKSLYFCQVEDHDNFRLAEEVPGPTTELLGRLARELQVVLIASLFERRAPGLYHNTAAILDADGRFVGKYRKMHVPDDSLYHEMFSFAPGDLGFNAWHTRYARSAVLVCGAQWH